MMQPPVVIDKRKKIVEFCMKNKVLLTRTSVERLQDETLVETLYTQITTDPTLAPSIVVAQLTPSSAYPVSVFWDYDDQPGKRTLQDFVGYFNARYVRIAKILRTRQELQAATSIGRVLATKEKGPATIIGIVAEKELSKNENLILTIEDPTGRIKAIVSKGKAELFALANDLVHDEIIGISGVNSGSGALFVNAIQYPDIPHQELKKAPDEAYAVFLSCVHVGSKLFLKEAFQRFIAWLHGQWGTPEQRAMAAKVGYLFLIGDTVDGVGIYPGQDDELEFKDIYEQYAEAARLFSQVPKHINIILSPGNHDAQRLSEPQPKLFKDYAKPLWDLPNVIMTGNPAIVTIHAKGGFPGMQVLTYHGYSFDDYSEIVPSIKNSGRNCSERTPLIMRFLLQRRHLAPAHTSTLYVPDSRSDPLVIDTVPDIFAAGHIHKSGVDQYRGVSLICCSTFQDKTDFQERMGHEPDPGKAPILNLQTRKVSIMDFNEAP
ncbi:metallophosphoesterase [Candidatus Woesearchaeota archaeon]|nr:metallophosphoesterase [Candidatus Woesearchaeota archaeon]